MDRVAQLEAVLVQSFPGAQLRWLDDEDPRFLSHGEIENPHGLGPRAHIPERGGLLCARIFGTVRDLSCICTKYSGAQHRGVTCEKCGVQVTPIGIRRERFGHMTLPVILEHPWERSHGIERLRVLPAGLREQPAETASRQELAGLNGLYQRVFRQIEQLARCRDHAAPSAVVEHETARLVRAVARLYGAPRQRPSPGPTLADHLHRALLTVESGAPPSAEVLAVLASLGLTLDQPEARPA